MRKLLSIWMSAVLLFVLCLPVFSGEGSRREIQNVYYHMDNEDMKIALTFDDGPNAKSTPKVLDVLQKHCVSATFFIIGENAEANPELIMREISEGHEIGNHTFTHLKIKDGTLAQMTEEISKTEKIIEEVCGKKTELFRPPEGRCSEKIAEVAASCGYRVILWNIDTRDWAHTKTDTMLNNIRKNIASGDIILFHDGIVGESHTAEALDIIIPELKSKGYHFVTVSELLSDKSG